MAKITVKTRGPSTFRRAGQDFGPEPREIDSDSLTPDQIEQLRAESQDGGMLEVTGLPAAPTPARTTGGAAAGGTGPSKGEVQTMGPAAHEHDAERPRRR